MPDWKEQLQQIQVLRLQQQQQDQQLYAVNLQLQKAFTQAKRSGRGETSLPAGREALSALRNKITGLETSLQDLNQELSKLNAGSEKIKGIDNYIGFIQKKNGGSRRWGSSCITPKKSCSRRGAEENAAAATGSNKGKTG